MSLFALSRPLTVKSKRTDPISPGGTTHEHEKDEYTVARDKIELNRQKFDEFETVTNPEPFKKTTDSPRGDATDGNTLKMDGTGTMRIRAHDSEN